MPALLQLECGQELCSRGNWSSGSSRRCSVCLPSLSKIFILLPKLLKRKQNSSSLLWANRKCFWIWTATWLTSEITNDQNNSTGSVDSTKTRQEMKKLPLKMFGEVFLGQIKGAAAPSNVPVTTFMFSEIKFIPSHCGSEQSLPGCFVELCPGGFVLHPWVFFLGSLHLEVLVVPF